MSINMLSRCHGGCDRLFHVVITNADINPPGLFFHLYEIGMNWSDIETYLRERYQCHECLERRYPHPYSNVVWRRYAEFIGHHETLVPDRREFLRDHPDFHNTIERPAFAPPIRTFSPTCSSCHRRFDIWLGNREEIILDAILTLGGTNFQQYSQTALKGRGFICWQCLRQNTAQAPRELTLFMNHLGAFLLSHTIRTIQTEVTRPVFAPEERAKRTLALLPGPQTTTQTLVGLGRIERAEETQRVGGSEFVAPEIKLASGAEASAAGGVGIVAAGLQLYVDSKAEYQAANAQKPIRVDALTTDVFRVTNSLSQITSGIMKIGSASGLTASAADLSLSAIGSLTSGGAGLLSGIITLADGVRVSFNNANAIRASAELFTILGSREFIRIIGQKHGIMAPDPVKGSPSDSEFQKMFWGSTHDSFWASAMWMAFKYHPSFVNDLLKYVENVGLPALGICTSIISICIATAAFPPLAGIAAAGVTLATIGTQSARLDRFRKSRAGYLTIMEGKVGGVAFTDPTIALCDLTFCEEPLGKWEQAFHKSLPTIHSIFSPKPTMGDYYRFTVAIYLYKAILEGHISDNPPIEGFPTIKSGVSSARLSLFLDQIQNLQRKIKRGEVHVAPNFQAILANLSELVNKLVQDSMVILFWNMIKHDAKRLVWKRAYDKAYATASQEYMHQVLGWINDMEAAYSLTFANNSLIRSRVDVAVAAAEAAPIPAHMPYQFLIIPDVPQANTPTPSEQKNSKIFLLPNENRYTALELCAWANYNAEGEANLNTPDGMIRSKAFQYCTMCAAACVIAQSAHGISRLLTERFPGFQMPQNLNPNLVIILYERSKMAVVNCLRLLYQIHPTHGTQTPGHPNTASQLKTLGDDIVDPLFDEAQMVFDTVNRSVTEYKEFQAAHNDRNTQEIQQARQSAVKKLCEILKR